MFKNVNKNSIYEFTVLHLSTFQNHVICFKRINVLASFQKLLYTRAFLINFIKENV